MKNVTLLWIVIGLIIGLANPMNDGSTFMHRLAFAIPWAIVFGGVALLVDLIVNWLKRRNQR